MSMSVETLTTKAVPRSASTPPSAAALVLIFWFAFATAAVMSQALNPAMFQREDPDSFLRLVQVHDLLNGQGWFDLVQHRLDPPRGILMHWSRLIDAPIAALALLGGVFGIGDQVALTAWPLLLLLGFMASLTAVATRLAGRGATLPTLLLTLVFFNPLLSFVPTDIDHHNAQLTLTMAALACVLRMRERPVFGLAAGLACAVSMAIGLEMMAATALFGVAVALRWAWDGKGGQGAALFGLAFAASPALLYMAAGSPAAAYACDSLSWSQAIPGTVAGLGLAAATSLLPQRVGRGTGRVGRGVCLLLLGAATAVTVMLVAPACLSGPYGLISPELEALWLSTVTEAQPAAKFFRFDPTAMVMAFGPPFVAVVVAVRRALRMPLEPSGAGWALAAALVALPLAMGFYAVRTLPLANAAAIPVLAAWIADTAVKCGLTSWRPLRRMLPVGLAVLLALPVSYLGLGWAGVKVIRLGTGGRLAPVERPTAPAAATASLSEAEIACFDPASAALLAQAPPGLVISPVSYGSMILALSPHSALAAPYHRGGAAIIDAVHATDLPPDRARAIFDKHAADYLAICTTSGETALTVNEAPDGLVADLMAGNSLAWLEPIKANRPTTLRLWRVRH